MEFLRTTFVHQTFVLPPRESQRYGHGMRRAVVFGLLLLAPPFLPSSAVAAGVVGDPFLCYRTRTASNASPFAGSGAIAVADRFARGATTLVRPGSLCMPANVDGAPPDDATTALLGYRTGRNRSAAGSQAGLALTTKLGTLTVDLVRPGTLHVPAATDPATDPVAPAGTNVNHYQCYAARRSVGTPPLAGDAALDVADGFGGTRRYDVGALRQVCTPLALGGGGIARAGASLACFRARRVRGQTEPARPQSLHVRDEFGAQRLAIGREEQVCLPATLDDGRCNGDASLCAKRYDQVAYPTTHNAMSNGDEGWAGPNQHHGIARQLDDGIRGLMLDTHYDGGAAYLCHEYCVLGKEPLAHGLAKIRRFLDLHPQDVVSIIFESYISEADVAAAFADAGLLDYVHAQPVDAPWPTLRTLVDARTRLVVFTDERGVLPWHHYVWDYASETPYSFETPADLSCRPNRGDPSHSLFILNHFLTQVLGNPAFAEQINHNPLFIDRAEQCRSERDRLPNFVTVDFYDIGDVLAVARTLNGL